jgi:hypothetical protein
MWRGHTAHKWGTDVHSDLVALPLPLTDTLMGGARSLEPLASRVTVGKVQGAA